MKSTGVVRQIDDLGRVVLPIELRRTLGISPKEPLEIFVENEAIIMQKYQEGVSSGMIRQVDDLGRIVLPIELRRTSDLSPRDSLEIFIDDFKIVFKKYAPFCVFCNSMDQLLVFKTRNVCRFCIDELNKL